jgi:hypothetical protein
MVATNKRSNEGGVERRMLAAFAAALPQAVRVEVLAFKNQSLVVRLGRQRLVLRWVGRAGVREVHDVLGLRDRPDVIVGSELSFAARAVAGETGLGWVDETGSAEVIAGNIVVSKLSRPDRMSVVRPNKWTPSVIGVAEAILSGTTPTVAAAAEATGHSLSSTAHALATLADMGMLQSEARRGPRSGRKVVDADRLLEEYAQAAAAAQASVSLRCGVVWRDPLGTLKRIGKSWDRAGLGWALTGAIAAAVLAPYLSEIGGGEVYVQAAHGPELLEMASLAGIEPMEGGRLVLRPFPTLASWHLAAETDGLRMAPWPRVYADLRLTGVRGEEAAEHLREVIGGR